MPGLSVCGAGGFGCECCRAVGCAWTLWCSGRLVGGLEVGLLVVSVRGIARVKLRV